MIFIPVATSSGEALEKRVGNPGEHAELGDQLIWFVLPLVVLAAALVWMDRRARHRPVPRPSPARSASPTALKVVAVLAVVAAVATSVQVYRVGDSGARAAWSHRVQATSNGYGSGDGD